MVEVEAEDVKECIWNLRTLISDFLGLISVSKSLAVHEHECKVHGNEESCERAKLESTRYFDKWDTIKEKADEVERCLKRTLLELMSE